MRLDAGGHGDCPHCGERVVGEPGSLVTYWHPIEACWARVVDQLREARRLLALHGVEVV